MTIRLDFLIDTAISIIERDYYLTSHIIPELELMLEQSSNESSALVELRKYLGKNLPLVLAEISEYDQA